MNIFITDINPQNSALALDDERVNKMATETAQLLSTAIRKLSDYTGDDIYQPFNPAHPCNLWARHSKDNFSWLVQHGIALCNEHKYRKGNRHDHAALKIILRCVSLCSCIPDGPLFSPANCTEFKRFHHPIIAYRHALNWKWYHQKRPPVWSRRIPPQWYIPVGDALLQPDTEEDLRTIAPDPWEKKMFKELSKDPEMAKVLSGNYGSSESNDTNGSA